MQNYFLDISYDGTAYHGWQIQPNAKSVQQVLQEGLSKILRKEVSAVGAGRTDTGVHAVQMICHAEIDSPIDDVQKFIFGVNSVLPDDVVLNKITPVGKDAHARFSATERSYIYKIHSYPSPFVKNASWFYPYKLDLKSMNLACEELKKFEDFSSFSKSNTQTNTNNCKIYKAVWKEENGRIEFRITADRFLRNMVRAIVGTCIEVGRGELDVDGFIEVIKSEDRSKAGLSVPAHGLYLSSIKYPEEIYSESNV